MGNNGLMGSFQPAHAIFLPHLTYDHCPAALIIPQTINRKRKAFKFANYIAEKLEFIATVEKE